LVRSLGKDEHGEPLDVDLETLVETRMLVTATSGGGKSGAIFQICEACSPHIQTIILDPEGEFSPLRAKYPFVLVGPEGDTPAAVRTAKLLAVRLLELGASAVIDLYELPPQQRHEYVRDFLDALIDAPKTLWPSLQGRGCLVIVDEAHLFGPEKGQGESVASGAMANLATRGRKRGLCALLSTQRLAMLSKTLAANCQNVMIGRTSQIDQARAAETLHIGDKTEKMELWRELAKMPVGKFYAYGMAFGATAPVEFQVDRAKTLPEKKDRMNLQPPPAPAAIQKLLPRLADIPQEAEKKAKTEEDLRAEIRELRHEIKQLNSQRGTLDPEREKMLLENIAGLQKIATGYEATLDKIAVDANLLREIGERITGHIVAVRASPDEPSAVFSLPITVIPKPRMNAEVRGIPAPRVSRSVPADGEPLTGPEQRILNAIAWMETIGVSEPDQTAVAFLAKYSYTSSSFTNPRGALNKAGLVRYVAGGCIALTEEGRKLAQYPDIEPTNESLHQAILAKLPGPETKLLTVLLKHYPKAVDGERLAEMAGYSHTSSSYTNPRGQLKILGLVEYPSPGMVVAKSLLFPEGK